MVEVMRFKKILLLRLFWVFSGGYEMNLSYTDEQNLLRDSVSKFCLSDYDFETRMKSVDVRKRPQ